MISLVILHTSFLALLGADLIYGQTTVEVTVLNTTLANEERSYSAKAPGNQVCTNETEGGEALWCYECKNNFAKVYDPNNAVCLNNISQVALRRCGLRDRYCKVERLDLSRQTMTIERGCVEDCYYGCRFNGYGLTQMKCTSCCRTPCCNSGNSAPCLVISQVSMVLGLLVSIVIQSYVP